MEEYHKRLRQYRDAHHSHHHNDYGNNNNKKNNTSFADSSCTRESTGAVDEKDNDRTCVGSNDVFVDYNHHQLHHAYQQYLTVAEAVKLNREYCRERGINNTYALTGDHSNTSDAIANLHTTATKNIVGRADTKTNATGAVSGDKQRHARTDNAAYKHRRTHPHGGLNTSAHSDFSHTQHVYNSANNSLVNASINDTMMSQYMQHHHKNLSPYTPYTDSRVHSNPHLYASPASPASPKPVFPMFSPSPLPPARSKHSPSFEQHRQHTPLRTQHTSAAADINSKAKLNSKHLFSPYYRNQLAGGDNKKESNLNDLSSNDNNTNHRMALHFLTPKPKKNRHKFSSPFPQISEQAFNSHPQHYLNDANNHDNCGSNNFHHRDRTAADDGDNSVSGLTAFKIITHRLITLLSSSSKSSPLPSRISWCSLAATLLLAYLPSFNFNSCKEWSVRTVSCSLAFLLLTAVYVCTSSPVMSTHVEDRISFFTFVTLFSSVSLLFSTLHDNTYCNILQHCQFLYESQRAKVPLWVAVEAQTLYTGLRGIVFPLVLACISYSVLGIADDLDAHTEDRDSDDSNSSVDDQGDALAWSWLTLSSIKSSPSVAISSTITAWQQVAFFALCLWLMLMTANHVLLVIMHSYRSPGSTHLVCAFIGYLLVDALIFNGGEVFLLNDIGCTCVFDK